MRYVSSSTDENNNPGVKVPSYTLLDTMLGYEHKNWDVSLNITNLSDKTYISSCNYWCYCGEGRRTMLNAKYKF